MVFIVGRQSNFRACFKGYSGPWVNSRRKRALDETIFWLLEGITAHATELIIAVALDPQKTSDMWQERSLARLPSGIIPSFSASASNSAAPPLARESSQFLDALCATAEVVATFA